MITLAIRVSMPLAELVMIAGAAFILGLILGLVIGLVYAGR